MFTAKYLPPEDGLHIRGFTKNFESEEEANKWLVENKFCDDCKEDWTEGHRNNIHCLESWDVFDSSRPPHDITTREISFYTMKTFVESLISLGVDKNIIISCLRKIYSESKNEALATNDANKKRSWAWIALLIDRVIDNL